MPIVGENSIIVKGTKHKNDILYQYSLEYGGTESNPIVTKKKGELEISNSDDAITRMKSSLDLYYQVVELKIYNVNTTVLKKFLGSFTKTDLTNFSCVDKFLADPIPKTLRWLRIDFSLSVSHDTFV